MTVSTRSTPDVSISPGTARALILAGLLPFIGLAIGSVVMDGAHAAMLHLPLVGYGGVILSFVGALHWGVALTHPTASQRDRTVLMSWSVVPALLGWVALMAPAGADLLLLASGFWAHLAFDWRAARRHALPGWYLPLRIVATSIATLCLLAPLLLGGGHHLADPHAWPTATGEVPDACPVFPRHKAASGITSL